MAALVPPKSRAEKKGRGINRPALSVQNHDERAAGTAQEGVLPCLAKIRKKMSVKARIYPVHFSLD